MAEKAYEKHAWIILFALGILSTLQALLFIIVPAFLEFQGEVAEFGFSWTDLQRSSPGAFGFIRFLLKNWGFAWLGFSLFTVAVALKGYRRGEKWAWYAVWIFPLVIGLFVVTAYAAGNMRLAQIYAVITILIVLVILLPYRKFFPKK